MEVWKRFSLIFFIPCVVALFILNMKPPTVNIAVSNELSEYIDKKDIQRVLKHIEDNYETATLSLRIKEVSVEELIEDIDRDIEYLKARNGQYAADIIAEGKSTSVGNLVAKYSFSSGEILLVKSNLQKVVSKEKLGGNKVLLGAIIHELMHLVQNKHVPTLDKVASFNDKDEILAYLSILEGHAQYFMKLFMKDVFSESIEKLRGDNIDVADFKYTYGEKYFNNQAMSNQQLWRLPNYLEIDTYELIHNISSPDIAKKELPVNLMEHYSGCQVTLAELPYAELYLYYKSLGMSDDVLSKVVGTETQVISCNNKIVSISRIYSREKDLLKLLKDLNSFTKKQLLDNNNIVNTTKVQGNSYFIDFNMKDLKVKGAIYRTVEDRSIIEIFISPLNSDFCEEPIAHRYNKLTEYCLSKRSPDGV